ncbi:MAG: recombination-associated protein RdgC [Myxococcota bacterium]
MGLFKGSLTVRRYRVLGEVPEDFRERYRENLEVNAFHEPMSAAHEGEVVGFTLIQNLLDTDFSDMNRWLFNHYLVAAMRIDKKVLPSKLFNAHLEQRVQMWCAEQRRERCPSKIKAEIKEALTQEMLLKTLPRVQHYEFAWNIVDGWVAFLNLSEGVNDKFRTLFRNTFGLVLAPLSPLDLLEGLPEVGARLEAQGISDYRPPAGLSITEGEEEGA